jgi:hypothetical protein
MYCVSCFSWFVHSKFSAPVDFGASIMTGLYGSPLNVLCKQSSQREYGVGFSTASEIGKNTVSAPYQPFPEWMHYLKSACDLYDSDGKRVDGDIDARAEKIFNKMLEGNYALKRNAGHPCEEPADLTLTPDEMDKIKVPAGMNIYSMDVG